MFTDYCENMKYNEKIGNKLKLNFNEIYVYYVRRVLQQGHHICSPPCTYSV